MKRNTRITGINDTKLEALKRLKEARQKGISRVQQDMQDDDLEIQNPNTFLNEKVDDFIDDDGNDHGYTFDISDDEKDQKKTQKMDKKSIQYSLTHMAANANNKQPIKKDKDLVKKADSLMVDLFNRMDEDDMGDATSRPKMNDLLDNNNSMKNEGFRTLGDFNNSGKKKSNNLNDYELNPSIAPSIRNKIEKSAEKKPKNKTFFDENLENDNNDIIVEMEVDDKYYEGEILNDNNNEKNNKDKKNNLNASGTKIPGRQLKTKTQEKTSNLKRDRQTQNSEVIISDRKITDAFMGRTLSNKTKEINNSNNNNNNSNLNSSSLITPNKNLNFSQSNSNNKELLNSNSSNNNNNNYLTPNNSSNLKQMNPENNNPLNNSNSTIQSRNSGISIRNSKQENLPINPEGSLFIFWTDMTEEKENGNELVVIYGKIFDQMNPRNFSSISLIVKNMNRIMHIIPKENKNTNKRYSLKEVREEFEELRKSKFSFINNYKTKETKKKYCFELPIEHGEYDVLEIHYNANQGLIQNNFTAKTFDYIFGKQSSLMETLIIETKIRGPCWLKVEKNGFYENKNYQFSNTKYEVHIENYKKFLSVIDVNNLNNNNLTANEGNNSITPININNYRYLMKTPPLSIMSISVKTIQNKENNQTEIYGICGLIIEKFLLEDEKNENDRQNLIPFLAIRKVDHPSIKFDDMEKIKNSNCFKGSMFSICQNETAVINQFVNKVSSYDPDVIVSHRSFEQIDLILNRISKLKISAWSKISRFKKDKLPKFLNQSTGNTNPQANYLVRNCTAGRLLCDMELNCRAYIKESSYELQPLVKNVLKKDFVQFDATKVFSKETENQLYAKKYSEKNDNIPLHELRHNDLIELVRNLINSIYLESVHSFCLMNKLSILPLTKELTNIGGNLWIKSLQNTRADRCEMLLMHEFHARNYLLPDKLNKMDKDLEQNEDFENEVEEKGKNIGGLNQNKGGKKKPKYSGGLVLEPIADLYDDIVLLLDFNSLYPSIIQEYNICFTTVDRKPTQQFSYKKSLAEGDNEKTKKKNKKNKKAENLNENENENEEASQINLEENEGNNLEDAEDINKFDLSIIKRIEEKSILPGILEHLVKKRKGIKEKMKFEKDPFKKDLMEIQQKAVKLSANSLYGYLGFGNSRFHAKAIAALITSIGRNILQNTVEMVKRKHELDVIYGDTDSIMINTKIKDISAAMVLGQTIKKSVNEKYRLLEMEMDGIFKTLLLLKKKKYAALKYEAPFGPNSELAKEFKGLDLVRRDWCELSKQVGIYILDIILSGKNKEDISTLILDFLGEIRQNLNHVNHVNDSKNKEENNEEKNNEDNSQNNNNNLSINKNEGYPLHMFEIIKSLSKKLEDYEKNASLPHVKVARRLMTKGDYSLKAHSLIPYIICTLKEGVEIDENSAPEPIKNLKKNKNLTEKAFHRTELEEFKEFIKIDIEWYKSNQIIAPVRRLCKHISQLEMHQLAYSLGLDASKYNFNKNNENENEYQIDLNNFNNNENKGLLKVKSKQGLNMKCFKCQMEKKHDSVFSFDDNIKEVYKCDSCKQMINDPEYDNYIYNKILTQNKINLLKYYNLEKTCARCKSNTKMFLINKCLDVNCKRSVLKPSFNNTDAFNEIKFIYNLIGCGNKKENEKHQSVMVQDLLKRNSKLREIISETYNRTDYNFIELENVFSCINFDEN